MAWEPQPFTLYTTHLFVSFYHPELLRQFTEQFQPSSEFGRQLFALALGEQLQSDSHDAEPFFVAVGRTITNKTLILGT